MNAPLKALGPPTQLPLILLCKGCGHRIPAEHFGRPSMHGRDQKGRKCRPKENPNG